MKQYCKSLLFLFVFLVAIDVQIAFCQSDGVIENIDYSSGSYKLCPSDNIVSPSDVSRPVNLYGTAQVQIASGYVIKLKAGFSAHGFNSGGRFHAVIESPHIQGGVTVVGPSCFNDPNSNGSANAAPIYGTGPYQYSFNGGSFSSTASWSGLTAGAVYTVTVRDDWNCSLSEQVTIPLVNLNPQ